MLLAKDAPPELILPLVNTAWANFVPRPDNPAEFDQQSAFVNARDLVSFLLGGNACLAGNTMIYDPVANIHRRMDSISKPFNVWSVDLKTGKRVIGVSSRPFLKGQSQLWRVLLSNGESFVSTPWHCILTRQGFFPVHVAGDRRCLQKLVDSQADCLNKSYSYDEPPLCGQAVGRVQPRQLSDVQARNHQALRQDDLVSTLKHSHSHQFGDHLSSDGLEDQDANLLDASCIQRASVCTEHCGSYSFFPEGERLLRYNSSRHPHTSESFPQLATANGSWLSSCDSVYITGIEPAGQGDYWDIEVYPHHNYELAGVFHHNSGKTAASCLKLSRFVLNTPPPRKNSPFWLVGATYKQICAVMWAEKLWGQQFIPRCEIQQNKITWHDKRMGWPATVPLKSWPNGNNWCLEMMSYEQGREAMQARSICGFAFSEQFAWPIFLEVLRGCRDNLIPGGQWAECTPIDPEMCVELERLMDKLPSGWGVYRTNTERNRLNLAPDWYDSFFGSVPDEMMATRKTGALATFEGVIYQTFNPAIHTTTDDSAAFRSGMTHHRATDWGASVEHPHVTLWACYDGTGEWTVYDEYWSTSQDAITQDHAGEVLARSIAWGWPEPEWFDEPGPARAHYVRRVRERVRELRPGGVVGPIEGSTYGENFADPSRPGEMNAFNYWGIPTSSASNDVYKGIDLVRARLKVNPLTNKPRLHFHQRAKHCVEEHRKYRWLKRRPSGLWTTAAPRPVPLKKDDDTCDATRYLIATVERSRGQTPTSTDSRTGDIRPDQQFARAKNGHSMRPMEAAAGGFFRK